MMFSPDRYVAALEFAAQRHLTQKIPGSDLPYVVHVTSVAAEVIAGLATTPVDDPELAVLCALLHDAIEDTPTTHAEIAERFGTPVADGVQALSKDASLPKEAQMADSLRRIRLQPREVWLVKLADRITNLDAPPHYWSREKRQKYRDEALTIAEALGSASAALDARIRSRATAYERYF